MNIIIHSKSSDPFSRVPKAALDDPNLSWKAKGILAYLIGKPADWKTQVTDLSNRSSDGKMAIRSGLMELREAGYAKLEKIREGGVITGWQMLISDYPCFTENNSSSPDVGFPHVENLDVEKRPISKKEVLVRKNNSSDDEFETFWLTYPKFRRVAKAAARRAWKKVDVPLATIITSLEQFKKTDQWKSDGGKYIPYPASWLNGRRWEDEVIERTQFRSCL